LVVLIVVRFLLKKEENLMTSTESTDRLTYEEHAFAILMAIAGMTLNPETGELEEEE
tara:strand:- start:9 stop:179 length:171 start_codon:yes stop_codon:yes gene_type:complete